MDLVSQLLANFNQSIEADISKHMEFKLEVWTCNPIQEADKEAWKTTPHTQFELDSPPALILSKGKPATAPLPTDSTSTAKRFRALTEAVNSSTPVFNCCPVASAVSTDSYVFPALKTWLKESLKRIQTTGNRFRAPSSSILVSSIPTQLPPSEVGLYIVLSADSYVFPASGGNSKTKDFALIVEDINQVAMEVFVANNVENLVGILELVPKVVSLFFLCDILYTDFDVVTMLLVLNCIIHPKW